MKSLCTVLIALGVTSASNLKPRIQSTAQRLAQTQTGVAHTCTYAIDRIKAGAADYKSIIGSGKQYTDASFPPTSDMISWSDRPRTDSGKITTTCTYSRIQDKFPGATLFGTSGITYSDIY